MHAGWHKYICTSSDVVQYGHLLHGDASLCVPLSVDNVCLHATNDDINHGLLHWSLFASRLHLGQLESNLNGEHEYSTNKLNQSIAWHYPLPPPPPPPPPTCRTMHPLNFTCTRGINVGRVSTLFAIYTSSMDNLMLASVNT